MQYLSMLSGQDWDSTDTVSLMKIEDQAYW